VHERGSCGVSGVWCVLLSCGHVAWPMNVRGGVRHDAFIQHSHSIPQHRFLNKTTHD
jgi:hypothetical protein